MGFLRRTLPRSSAPEWLDQPDLDPRELQENLRDLERLNRLFGGVSSVLSSLGAMVRRRGLSDRISVLDAGTGGADIPRAIVRWGAERGVRADIVACDCHEQILQATVSHSARSPRIAFVQADALRLPFPPRSFDFAVASLLAHHLSDSDAVGLVRQLDRVSRFGFVVSDLRRGRLAWAGAWAGTRLFARSNPARRDGPASVLRSYTLNEMRDLARRAGCADAMVRRHPFFRLVLVREKPKSKS